MEYCWFVFFVGVLVGHLSENQSRCEAHDYGSSRSHSSASFPNLCVLETIETWNMQYMFYRHYLVQTVFFTVLLSCVLAFSIPPQPLLSTMNVLFYMCDSYSTILLRLHAVSHLSRIKVSRHSDQMSTQGDTFPSNYGRILHDRGLGAPGPHSGS